ncbi:hypothetical protein [Sulfitobacter aestuariivivens]
MSGWIGTDAAVIWDLGTADHVTKFDATLGLNLSDSATGMLQLYLTHLDGRMFTKLAPSVVIKTRRGKARYQIGFESPLESVGDTSLKLGLWREF